MTDFSAPSDHFTPSYDPTEIEKRLNALAGNMAVADERTATEKEVDPVDQFFSDESIDYVETRSSSKIDGSAHHTVIQLFRIRVQPNQTRLVIHPSFRPDLPGIPKIEATAVDRDARIRITHSAAYGARLEINLAESKSNHSSCCLEVISTAAQPGSTDHPNLENLA